MHKYALSRAPSLAVRELTKNELISYLLDLQGCTAKTLAMQCKQTGVAQTLTELENFGYSYVYPLLVRQSPSPRSTDSLTHADSLTHS